MIAEKFNVLVQINEQEKPSVEQLSFLAAHSLPETIPLDLYLSFKESENGIETAFSFAGLNTFVEDELELLYEGMGYELEGPAFGYRRLLDAMPSIIQTVIDIAMRQGPIVEQQITMAAAHAFNGYVPPAYIPDSIKTAGHSGYGLSFEPTVPSPAVNLQPSDKDAWLRQEEIQRDSIHGWTASVPPIQAFLAAGRQ